MGWPEDPIVISVFQDTLSSADPYYEHKGGLYLPRVDEQSQLQGRVGVHSCGGYMSLLPLSITHNVIICQQCFLRLVVPKTVFTYADLRQHLTNQRLAAVKTPRYRAVGRRKQK